MIIVDIFAEQLYSLKYEDESFDEYTRLMLDMWKDPLYLREFAKSNGVKDPSKFAKECLKDRERMEDFICDIIESDDKNLSHLFQPLHDQELGFVELSLQKGKQNRLRLYALKIENSLFLITGGAIKMSQAMQDHPDTRIQKEKLEYARDYLRDHGVFDSESFYEFKSGSYD